MTRISWEQLDRCATADEIADLLRHHGICGRRYVATACPLARATGWTVGSGAAYTLTPKKRTRPLTPAQQDFVVKCDDGEYPELIEGDALDKEGK